MKKLAIISAKLEQEPLVLKAKEMGIETHCFAWDKEYDNYCKGIADYFHPISILEKEQILEKCREIKIDGITTILSDYAVPTIAFVAQNMGLIGNCFEDMVTIGNKFAASQNFLKHGIQAPRAALVQKGQERIDLSEFNYPLIVKPTDRSTAFGVIKVEKEEDLQKAISLAHKFSFCSEALIEEYIEGLEVSIDTISFNGEHHIMAIKEREMIIIDKSPWKISGHYPFELPADILNKIAIETKKALDSVNFKYGASNTEFRLNDAGELFILEVNPRMAGDFSWILMQLYNGYDVLKGVIDVALGQFEKPVFPYKKYSGIYFCRENTEWIKKIIENKDNDPDIVEAELFHEDETHASRLGYFIYQSEQKRRWSK